MTYLQGHGPRSQATPQSLPLLGSTQVQNSAGGYAWEVDEWTRLARFLVLGSEGGSYYASEQKLTRENAESVVRCIQSDGQRTVEIITAISESGRAPKNDPALFALAMCASLGTPETKQAAFAALPRIARIGTHLFHFLSFVEEFRGWGRGLRKAIASWYTMKPAQDIAYQAIKYQQRDGWSHRDALRLAHPKTEDVQHNTLYHWMTHGWDDIGEEPHPDEALRLIWAFERAKRATTCPEIVRLIEDYHLPREAIPTPWLTEASVWESLLFRMPMEAMVRNLATMTRVGLITSFSDTVARICHNLRNQEHIHRSRLHPIKILAALLTYQQGQGVRGNGEWTPVQPVVDALTDAFYLAFQNVEPASKRVVLALDVSGSMGSGVIAGIPGLTPMIGAAAMGLVTASTEPHHVIMGFSHTFVPVPISPRQRLDDVVRTMQSIPMGRTDCSLPMIWALENGVEADAFVVYTDSETWFGNIHPVQALQTYRHYTGVPAKLIVVGMVANRFSIADPNDPGMLDVVGFDTATPALIADMIADRM